MNDIQRANMKDILRQFKEQLKTYEDKLKANPNLIGVEVIIGDLKNRIKLIEEEINGS